MRIPTEFGPGNIVICKSSTCGYYNSCANHVTASGFRLMDGFMPEMFEERGVFYCYTQSVKPNPNYLNRPQGILPMGFVSFQNGEFVPTKVSQEMEKYNLGVDNTPDA